MLFAITRTIRPISDVVLNRGDCHCQRLVIEIAGESSFRFHSMSRFHHPIYMARKFRSR